MNLKNLFATSVLATLLATAAHAQTATVSVTDASVNGVNTRTVGQAAASPTYVPNDGKTLLVVDNRQTSNVTLTLVTQATSFNSDGYGTVPLSNIDITIPSSSISVVGPFAINRWTTVGGLLRANFSSTTSISVTAVRTPR